MMIAQLFLCIALQTPSTVAWAQNARQPAAGRPGTAAQRMPRTAAVDQDLRIFALKYCNAENVARTVNAILGVTVQADSRTNSLFVIATDAEFEKITNLIAELDVPISSVLAGDEVGVVSIVNRDVQDLARRMVELYHGELKVSEDRAGRRVLMKGTTAQLDAARALIQKLDTPPPTATVEFAIIRINADADESTTSIPDDLKPVTRQIERFGEPTLMGRLMTVAMESDKFSVVGQIALNSEVKIVGTLLSASDDGAVKLSINARLKSMKFLKGDSDHENDQWEDSDFGVETTVVVKRGDYVLLGSAPHGFKPGELVVLVVHVPAAS